MENCIDLIDYGPTRTMVVIKQPGSTRHTATGDAIEKIEMTLAEAVELRDQLTEKLAPMNAPIITHTFGLD